MSLLLDALKQAEKERNKTDEEGESSAPKKDENNFSGPDIPVDAFEIEEFETAPHPEDNVTAVSETPDQSNQVAESPEVEDIAESSNNIGNELDVVSANKLDRKPELNSSETVNKSASNQPEITLSLDQEHSSPDEERNRQIAKSVFETKKPASIKTEKKPLTWIALTTVSLLIAAAFWLYQVNAPLPDSAPIMMDEEMAMEMDDTPLAEEEKSLEIDYPASSQTSDASDSKSTETNDTELASIAFNTADNKESYTEESGIKISKRVINRYTRSALPKAFDHLNSGNLSEAETAFRKALASSPNNVDGLLGLASTLVEKKQNRAAYQLFQKAYEIEPGNTSALSGMIRSSAENGNLTHALSKLKQLALEHPDDVSIQISLGDLYARNKQWSAAQTAYFKAVALDSEDANYLYNLAISLDQLKKISIAARYYQKALDQSRNKPVRFDVKAVQNRLKQISSQ